jgi:hypothetical protein
MGQGKILELLRKVLADLEAYVMEAIDRFGTDALKRQLSA